MSLVSKIFGTIAAEDNDMNAIRKAIKIYSNYKKHEAEAAEISEAERKEAEEALAFLKLNDNDPNK